VDVAIGVLVSVGVAVLVLVLVNVGVRVNVAIGVLVGADVDVLVLVGGYEIILIASSLNQTNSISPTTLSWGGGKFSGRPRVDEICLWNVNLMPRPSACLKSACLNES